MSNTFFRLPIENGDENTWAQYVLALEKNAIGDYTCLLYDDSGTLKLTLGRIGINNGTTSGIVINDTVTTISMAAVSNSNWAKIEMTVSGITPTYAASDISGETKENSIPSEFGSNWDDEKNGIYISSTKRTIGMAYKDSGGTLGSIISTNPLVKDNANVYIPSTKGIFKPGLLKRTHIYSSPSISTTYVNGSVIYNEIENYVPNVGDYIDISGTIVQANGLQIQKTNLIRVEKTGVGAIRLHGVVDRVIDNTGASLHAMVDNGLFLTGATAGSYKCVLVW